MEMSFLNDLLMGDDLMVGGTWYNIIDVNKDEEYVVIVIYDDDFCFNDTVGNYIEIGFDWYEILCKGGYFKEIEIPFDKIKKTDICPF